MLANYISYNYNESSTQEADMETLQVNIHEAKTQLSKLIQEALKGKEVITARGYAVDCN